MKSKFVGNNQFSGKSELERFWEKVDKKSENECWEWLGAKHWQWRYGEFKLGKRIITAHRYMWELTHYKIPNNMCVCHSCDNPPCCNPNHLFLGTVAQNNLDKKIKGRQDERGEKNGRAKIVTQDVITIRNLHKNGESYAALGRQYSLNPVTISNICKGKLWRHIEEGMS